MRRQGHSFRRGLLFFAVCLGPSFAYAGTCADPFAEDDALLDFHLRMTQQQWHDLRNLPPEGEERCERQYPYFEVDFRCGDTESWIKIGVRRKRGEQRGKDTEHKPPMKLDFNRYVRGQSWPESMGKLGMRKLTLNSGQADEPGGQLTALLTEHVAWKLMGTVVEDAPKTSYARVYIHFSDDQSEAYHGVYVLIEDIDRRAIRRRFGDDRGTLLKTTSSCRHRAVFDDGRPNDATAAFEVFAQRDAASDDEDWASYAAAAMDLPVLLSGEATRAVLANDRDSLTGPGYSNFFSYDPLSGTRLYLPWDLDDAFRPFPNYAREASASLGRNCSDFGNLTRCHPAIAPAYLKKICELINGPLAADRLHHAVIRADEMVRPVLRDEQARVWAGLDPLEPDREDNYEGEYQRVLSWSEDRIPALREQLYDLGLRCEPGKPGVLLKPESGCACVAPPGPGPGLLGLGLLLWAVYRRPNGRARPDNTVRTPL